METRNSAFIPGAAVPARAASRTEDMITSRTCSLPAAAHSQNITQSPADKRTAFGSSLRMQHGAVRSGRSFFFAGQHALRQQAPRPKAIRTAITASMDVEGEPEFNLSPAGVGAAKSPGPSSYSKKKPFVSRYKPGELRKGSDIVVEALEREGVDLVFAYPGGATMEIHQALTRAPSIRNILCRHEQGEVFAAEGYAKCSGKVGVCIATSGPGATNLVTGIADALMDSVPMVAITGQVPRHLIGKDAFQETPIIEITRSITKHNHLVTTVEEIPRVIKEAFHIARTGRPGPVLVDIPKDIQQTMHCPVWPDEIDIPGYAEPPQATIADMEEVAQAICAAKKPVLYVGGGALHAAEEVKALVKRTGIPVAQTLMGLGSFPMTDPLALEMLGMHGTVYANYAVHNCDLLLAFGVRFDDRVTGKLEKFAQGAKIVHIDIDAAEIDKNKVAAIAVQSDIKPALQLLNKLLDERTSRAEPKADIKEWVDAVETVRRANPLMYSNMIDLPANGSILPQHAIQLLWEMTKGKAVVSTGVGQHQMWAAQYYKFDEPRNWVTSGGLGSMGFGLPSALGCAAARPEDVIVNIDGDGSFCMNVQELATCYVEKLGVKTVILNNQHLGMVVQWEDRFYESNRGDTFIGDPTGEGIYPDFVEVARGFRVPAERVTKWADLRGAYERMLATPGPYLLDVIVPHQEHVLPMIPGGQSFDEVITTPWKPEEP
eukprot:tig00020516_g9968.t1